EEDIPVNVVTKEEGKVPSDPAGTKVPKREHSATPTKVEFVADPSDPTKGKLEGKVENVPEGTKVVATTPEGEELSGTTDPEGRFSIPVERKEEDIPVNVVTKEEGKVPSDPVTTQVPKQEHSATPTKVEFVADPSDPTKGKLEGKVSNVPEGTKVVATTPEGEELSGTTDPEGRFSIPVERKEEDTPVNVVVKEEGKVPSDPAETKVPKQEHSATPTEVTFVSDPSDPTKGRLEGKVENVPEGTKVVATTPEGEEIQGETDPTGHFSIPVERKEEDIPVQVVAKEEGKVPSDPAETKVPKQEHSATPTEVEFVSDSNDPTKGRLEGKVENVPEGTKVVAITPEGEEIQGETDPTGHFSIPVERGEEDIPVNVVVKEEGKVPSDPVSAIVSKVKRADNPELEKLSSSRKKNQSSKADGQIVKRELSQTSFKDKEKDLNNANNLEIVTGNTPTNDSSKNEKTNNHNSTNLISGRKELPKTGAQAHLEMSVIGTLLTGLSGVSLFGIKKEEKKMINTSSG
ncbi:LPXTG cell wall anchor domain-containing protein, partial [Enterococcus villorum]|uniref:LPXTG cell wall anchor domain-containing protein n=1 Tax=Enterococcus villorum TaxID=112904 RepID=UPI00117840BD